MVRTLQYYSVPGGLGKCRGRLCRKFSVLHEIDILLSSSRWQDYSTSMTPGDPDITMLHSEVFDSKPDCSLFSITCLKFKAVSEDKYWKNQNSFHQAGDLLVPSTYLLGVDRRYEVCRYL